eukprot:tig00000829_g4670.t1
MSFFGAFSTRTLVLRPAAAAARHGPFCKLVSTRAIFTSAPRNHSPDEGSERIRAAPGAQYTTREVLDAVRRLETSMNNMASKTEIGGLDNKIGALDNKIGALDNKIGALKVEVEAVKVEVEAVKSKIGIAVTLWQILAFGITLLSALFSVQSGLVSISIPRKAGAGGEGPQ